MSETQVQRLMLAYLERKKFEARILVGTLGEAMGGKKKDEGPMPLAALAAMGFGIRGV